MYKNLDLSIKPDRYYAQARPEMIDFIPISSNKILDAGCGEGEFSRQLKDELNAEVWGAEIDPNAAALAKKKIDRVIVGDISQLINKLPDAYFDCIVFNDVLEHLVDPFRMLQEIKGKINTGGVIVCSIPNVRYFRTLKKLLVQKQWKYKNDGILDKTHLRFFTYRSIIDMFDSLGYEILKIEGVNAIMSWEFKLLNLFCLGYLSDTRYLRFACVAKPK